MGPRRRRGNERSEAYRVELQAAERGRIATWLKAKALETEELLSLAADRADADIRAERKRQAHQTRAVIAVLAMMVEKNELPLTEPEGA